MSVINVGSDSFDAEVVQTEGLVVVDFWAEWCGPCKQLGPIFEKVASDTPDVKFVKVDVDANSDIMQQLGIRGIPTVMFFIDGAKVDTVVGSMSEAKLRARLTGV